MMTVAQQNPGDEWSTPVLQPTDKPDPGAPQCQNPPKVVKVSDRTPRVMFDYNPTPIYGANPNFIAGSLEPDKNGNYAYNRVQDSAEYMLKLGFETSFMVYNGTLNRSQLWWDKTKDDFRQGLDSYLDGQRLGFDWSLEANHCDPVTPEAARACSILSRMPWAGGAKLLPYQAIILDIEGTNTYNYNPTTFDQAMTLIKAWLDKFKLFRQSNPNTELYACFLTGFYAQLKSLGLTPDQDAQVRAADQEMMSQLTGIMPGFYNFDPFIENPPSWGAMVDGSSATIEKYYPWIKNRWAILTITNEVYWPSHMQDARNRAKAGTPISLDLWKWQVRYLMDRGYHLYLWIPQGLKMAKPYLDFVAKYH